MGKTSQWGWSREVNMEIRGLEENYMMNQEDWVINSALQHGFETWAA